MFAPFVVVVVALLVCADALRLVAPAGRRSVGASSTRLNLFNFGKKKPAAAAEEVPVEEPPAKPAAKGRKIATGAGKEAKLPDANTVVRGVLWATVPGLFQSYEVKLHARPALPPASSTHALNVPLPLLPPLLVLLLGMVLMLAGHQVLRGQQENRQGEDRGTRPLLVPQPQGPEVAGVRRGELPTGHVHHDGRVARAGGTCCGPCLCSPR